MDNKPIDTARLGTIRCVIPPEPHDAGGRAAPGP